MKTILITIAATVLITTTLIAASTYLWLQSLPRIYTCQKISTT